MQVADAAELSHVLNPSYLAAEHFEEVTGIYEAHARIDGASAELAFTHLNSASSGQLGEDAGEADR